MIKLSLKDFLLIEKKELSGKVLCFSTDTVWGVGVMVDDNISIGLKKIYEMKKRDLNKPLAVLASNQSDFIEHIIYQTEMSKLFDYWPGALTLIFNKKDNYFDKVTNLKTIGIRIPKSIIALKILEHVGLTATTSVNISAGVELNDARVIERYFSDYIDYLIVDDEERSKVSSTVIDVSSSEWKILRRGDQKINV